MWKPTANQIYPIVIALLIVGGVFGGNWYFKTFKQALNETQAYSSQIGFLEGVPYGRKQQSAQVLKEIQTFAVQGYFTPSTTAQEFWVKVK